MKDRAGDGEAWANLLVCPVCHRALTPGGAQALNCTGCGRSYPVVDGIAHLLVDEAGPEQQTKAEPQTKAGRSAKAEPQTKAARPAKAEPQTQAEPGGRE